MRKGRQWNWVVVSLGKGKFEFGNECRTKSESIKCMGQGKHSFCSFGLDRGNGVGMKGRSSCGSACGGKGTLILCPSGPC